MTHSGELTVSDDSVTIARIIITDDDTVKVARLLLDYLEKIVDRNKPVEGRKTD